MRFIPSGTDITIKVPKELVPYNVSSFGTYYIIVELLFNDRRLVSSFNFILLYHTCHTILLLIISAWNSFHFAFSYPFHLKGKMYIGIYVSTCTLLL